MIESVSFRNMAPSYNIGAILFGPKSELFGPRDEFLFRKPVTNTSQALKTNEVIRASPQAQRDIREGVLVRLPSLRESKWKVRVLQRWVGRVEHVDGHRFVAVLDDATSSLCPQEQVELDLSEVSESDLTLLVPGATFYWSIGYRDTPGGQRERISTLRFARHPRLSKTEVSRIFEHADQVAALLDSE